MSTMYDSVVIRFENNILDTLRSDSLTGKLFKDGRLREKMRAEMQKLIATTGFEASDQIKFLQFAGKTFEKYGEYSMAQDSMELVLEKCTFISDSTLAAKTEIEALHAVARCTYAATVANDQHQLAPMAVGKILGCLQKICDSLDLFLGLPTKAQEAHAYLALNSCKLLFDMGHPLVWISCGKYIIEMFFFGIMAINSVINLCTPRHLNFRMKMYSSVFLAAVTQDTSDMAAAVLNHCVTAVKQLRTREELETPIPDLTARILGNAECDIDVLRQVLGFWKDADGFSPYAFAEGKATYPNKSDKQLFAEKCFLECSRVQQLTTGNINEPWKKRSRGLLKSFVAFSESTDFDLSLVSVRCVSDIMSSILFDVNADETGVAKLRALVASKLEQISVASETVQSAEETFDGKQLSLLHQLLAVMDTRTLTKQNIVLVRNFLSEISALSFTDEFMKRRTFVQRAAIGVWNRCIFPAVRMSLSRDVAQKDHLKTLATPLLSVTEILISSMSHDPVFVGSVAVVTAHVLREIGHSRECVQHLLQSIAYIDDHRAARTDIRLQYPEEVRDISALQHQSISVRSEYKNWFHAYKRLGAHAFAGFGIFGASSSMYREDIALAEMHADLLTCYFGVEIAYAIAQRSLRGSDVIEHKASKSKTSKHGKTAITEPTAAVVKIEDPQQVEESKFVVGVSNMAVAKQLRSWCRKNSYAKCLLLIELARVEAMSEERVALLEEAISCVEVAEQREKDIVSAFADLTVMKDKEPKYPIVLSRSHKFFYVLPVGCRAQKKAHYYKILAREEGSGTDLGPSSDELVGCDLRVLASALQYPSANVAVRIEVLTANEKYVFGSAAFRENGQLLSQMALSPTSIPVEAVNPLSTIALWGQIAVVAANLEGCLPLARRAAAVVCARYFLVSPRLSVRNIGRMGYNLFACEEPAISALVVHQSSEQQLYVLVRSFIITQQTEETGIERVLREIGVHGALRMEFQVEVLNVLKRLAIVTVIASYIKSQELVSQCVYLGYHVCSQLLREDDVALAAYLSQTLMVLIAAMQQIPKRQWHEMEHVVFCRLVSEAVKCATITKNVEAFSRLIEKIHPDGSPSIITAKSDVLNGAYGALISSLHQGHGFFLTSDIRKQLMGIVANEGSSPREELQLWAIPAVQRFQIMRGIAEEAVALKASGAGAPGGVPATKAMKTQASTISKAASTVAPSLDAGPKSYTVEQVVQAWFAAAPLKASDLIVAIVFWAKELFAKAKFDQVILLVKIFPIKRHLLTEEVQKLCKEWEFDFLDNSDPPPVESPPPPSGEKSPRSAIGSPPGSRPGTAGDRATSRGSENEDAAEFEAAEAVENAAQLQGFAELSRILAEVLILSADVARELSRTPLAEQAAAKASLIFPKFGRRQYYPKSLDGPLTALDTHDPDAALSASELALEPVEGEAVNSLPALRFMCCSVVLFSRCGYTNAAVDVSTRLWNIIVDSWVHPKNFALECIAVTDPNIVINEAAAAAAVEDSEEPIQAPDRVHILTMTEAVIAATASMAGVLEVVSRVFQDEDLAADKSFFPNQSQSNKNADQASVQMVLATCTDRESKEYLFSMRNIVNFLIKVMWLFRSWQDVVDIGIRITTVYAQRSPLDISRAIMESTWGYIIHAQTQLMKIAHERANTAKSALEKFIGDWEDVQSKKRKKKARIARVEKDPDELEYEKARSDMEENLQRLDTLFEVEQNRLNDFNQDQKRILGCQPIGIQLLDRVRQTYRDFMLECYTNLNPAAMKQIFDAAALDPLQGCSELPLGEQRQDAFAAVLQSNRVLDAKFNAMQKDYDEVSSFFREKKDIVGLVEGLHEQGDVLLLFGRATEARAVWNDAVDGIFHAIDSVTQWQRLVADAITHHGPAHQSFITCMFPMVAVLGKLSAFCASNDFDKKSDYCRLAATICQVPFTESLGHPKTASGFGTYECFELGGVGYLLCNSSRLSAAALSFSLVEILDVLIAENEYLLALPCVVLLEHLHACYTTRADSWLNARLRRVRILISLHHFSEAACMIAGISTGVQMVAARKHNIPQAEFEAIRRAGPASEGGKVSDEVKFKFEVSPNGLDYYGLAPYWNNLPPHNDKNKAAIAWIQKYPTTLWEAIRENPLLRMDLPGNLLPKDSEPPAVLAKSDSKVPPKANTKQQSEIKGQPSTLRQASTMGNGQLDRFGSIIGEEANSPTLDSLVTARHLSALKIECAAFVSELLGLDTKTSTKCRAYFDQLTASAETELSEIIKDLAEDVVKENSDPDDPFSKDTSGQRSPRISMEKKNPWINAEWVAQFCRANLGVVSLLTNQRRNLIAARSGLVCFQKVLLGGMDSAEKEMNGEVPYRVLFTVKNTWMMLTYQLVELAERQGRFDDAVRLASRGAMEVSSLCWSHWLRFFLFYRAKVLAKLGRLDSSEMDCNEVLASFDYYTDVLINGPSKQLYISRSSGHLDAARTPTTPIGDRTRLSLLLARTLVLKASTIRMRSVNESSADVATLAVRHCIKLTKAAIAITKSLAASVGFLGSDANVTFRTDADSGNRTMMSEHHLLPPLLHSLTNIHPNDPLLSIDPVPTTAKCVNLVTKSIATTTVNNISKTPAPTAASTEEDSLFSDTMRLARLDVLAQYSGNVSLGFFHRPELRLGPVDSTGPLGDDVVYTTSEYANISLVEVRALALCIAALGKVVIDAEPLISVDRAKKIEKFSRGAVNEEDDEADESDSIPIEVLVELATEEGLKLLRHIAYPSVFLRSSLLLNAGVFRARPRISVSASSQTVHTKSSIALSPTRRAGGMALVSLGALQADPVPGDAPRFDDFSRMGRTCVDPLRRGLEICVTGNVNPWEAMRAMCVQLVERYGSDRLTWSGDDAEDDPVIRLSHSAYFLQMAIQLTGCIRSLHENPLDLTSDKSFSDPCPAEISSLLEAVTSSSVSKSRAPGMVPAAAASVPVKGTKVPVPVAATTASQLTGRDALFALSALFRETDCLWLDGYEFDYIADLHVSLVNSFPVYKEKCTIKQVPDTSNVELKVSVGSISSLWMLACNEDTRARKATSGLYDGVTGYFLLGANEKSLSTDPLLTRANLSFTELVSIEKESALLRDSLLFKTLTSDYVATRCRNLLIRLYTLLKQDTTENDISAAVRQEGDAWCVDLSENSSNLGGNGRKLAFQISTASMGALASAFSLRTGSSNMSEASVSGLFWLCLA